MTDILETESDAEQKVIWSFLTSKEPKGLGIPSACIKTKTSLRSISVDKGNKQRHIYPDYCVIIEGVPVMIVEAKNPRTTNLTEAAKEARLYAGELNAEYPASLNPCAFCVVSNGKTMELRSVDSEQLLCVVNCLDNSFAENEMTAMLVKIGFTTLEKHAKAMRARFDNQRFHRPLKMLGGSSVREDKIENNSFGRALFARFQYVFNPDCINDRKRIVQNAYVTSSRRTAYNHDVDRMVRNSVPLTQKEFTNIEDISSPKEVTNAFDESKKLKNKLLLLVGGVGAGKSTFVDYLQMVAFPRENLDKKVTWIRLDLNTAPLDKSTLYKWCQDRIISELKSSQLDIDCDKIEHLKKMFRRDISAFQKGIGSLLVEDSPEYNKALYELLQEALKDNQKLLMALEKYLCSGREKLLIIVLDNCDKKNSEEQLLMFETAKWLQSQIDCLIVLPLREETYEVYHNKPPLDTALKDLMYRIDPPPFQDILKKRLSLIKVDMKEKDFSKIRYSINDNLPVEFTVDKVEEYLSKMMSALFNHAEYGKKVVIGLAGKNMRRAFEIFLDFCRSGYLGEDVVFATQVIGRSYQIKEGVIANVLFRTNYRYYDGNRSYVKNVFQCDPQRNHKEPLLRYKILKWFENKRHEVSARGLKGYVSVRILLHDFHILDVAPSIIMDETNYLIRENCLLTDNCGYSLESEDSLVTITPAGMTHVSLAENDLRYIAACAEDCWISDEELAFNVHRRMIIEPYHQSLGWQVTLDTANELVNYLSETEAKYSYLTELEHNVPSIPFESLQRSIQKHINQFHTKQRSPAHKTNCRYVHKKGNAPHTQV